MKFILCQGDKSGWLLMCFFGPWSAPANTDQHWEAGYRTGVIAVADIFYHASV